jgi:hypothetical protein
MERRGPQALGTEELKENMNSYVLENRIFIFSVIHENFPDVIRSLTHENFTDLLKSLAAMYFFRQSHTKAVPTTCLTYAMEHSPSLEANRFTASQ